MSNLSGFVKRIRDIMRNDAGINGDAQRIEQMAWILFLKVYDAKENDWEFNDEAYESIIPEPCRWYNWAHDDMSGNALTGDNLLNFVNNILFPVLKGKNVKDFEGNEIKGIEDDSEVIMTLVSEGAEQEQKGTFEDFKKTLFPETEETEGVTVNVSSNINKAKTKIEMNMSMQSENEEAGIKMNLTASIILTKR